MLDTQEKTRKVTDVEVAGYRADGYLKIDLRQIVGDARIDRMIDKYMELDAAGYPHSTASWNKNPQAQFTRHHELSQNYPEFAEVGQSREMGELAARLIGVDHIRFYEDETLIKYPGDPETFWHQDLPYVPFDRRGFMTFWVAVEDITAEMGAMRYVPRSHFLGPVGRSTSYDTSRMDDVDPEAIRRARAANNDYKHRLRDNEQDMVGDPVSFNLKPGEAVVHDGLTFHGAYANSSGKVRRGYGAIFFPEDAQYTGAPRGELDGLGLVQFQKFDHPKFPVIF